MKNEARCIRLWALNMWLGKLIAVFWSFLWDGFMVWFLYRLENLNKAFSYNDHKTCSSHLQVSILYQIASARVYLTVYGSLNPTRPGCFWPSVAWGGRPSRPGPYKIKTTNDRSMKLGTHIVWTFVSLLIYFL